MSKSTQANHGNIQSKWAPLSYPSACIFSRNDQRTFAESPRATATATPMERTPNPYFPLHFDVLCAAVRELFLLHGVIDAKTLKLTEALSCRSSSRPKNVPFSSNAPPHVIPLEHCHRVDSQRRRWDYGRFRSSQQFVEHVVRGAIPNVAPPDDPRSHRMERLRDGDEEISSCESDAHSHNTTNHTPSHETKALSKRKVSDVDDDREPTQDNDTTFPHPIVDLVRSNVLLLRKFSRGSTANEMENANGAVLSESSPTTTKAELVPNIVNDDNSHTVNDDAIVQFLRFPQLQKQQPPHATRPFFVLPRLLQADIQTESRLRQTALAKIRAMLRPFDLVPSLRTFLGYKSSKSIRDSKLMELFAAVLFDVSHAMYAWVQTEKEMRFRSHPQKESEDRDVLIRESLFDSRALGRIGGFEPASLLPLALGIRRCRRMGVTWEEYASTMEGKKAMELHGRGVGKGERGKRQRREELLELGKRRRGRRGRSVGWSSCAAEVGEESFVDR